MRVEPKILKHCSLYRSYSLFPRKINNITNRRFLIPVLVAVIVILVCLALFLHRRPQTIQPTFPSGTIITLKDPNGTEEINAFLSNDNIYLKGSGMPKNHHYKIYIIEDTTIIQGMHIPTNVTAVATITTDENGTFSPTLVWSAPLTLGGYDIVADSMDSGIQGYYDSPDAIDDGEIRVTAGFFVISETSTGTIAALLASFTVAWLLSNYQKSTSC